jgi:PEP-CTERM motif
MNKMARYLCIPISVLASQFASASAIEGFLYQVPEATAQAGALPSNIPTTPAAATFQVNTNTALAFSGNDVGGTSGTVISNWLASGNAYNIQYNNANTATSLLDNGTTGTLIEFTGTINVTTGQTFTSTHDDGLYLSIGGINLGFGGGPTSASTQTETYTGASGLQSFTLVYMDCCGGATGDAAILDLNLLGANSSGQSSHGQTIPEPGTLTLLALGGFLMYSYRRKSSLQAQYHAIVTTYR